MRKAVEIRMLEITDDILVVHAKEGVGLWDI